MKSRTLLATGIVGSAITALCCFTPLLAVLLGSIGLAALLIWLDYLLIPALLFFLGLTLYALSRRDGKKGRERGCE